MTTKKIIIVHLSILAVLLAVAGWGYYKYWNVAEVNGKGISRVDYIKMLEKQGGKQVIEMMVQEEMIKQEAAKKSIKVEQAIVDAELKKIEDQIKAQGMSFETALESQGLTKEDLINQIKLKKMVMEMAKPTTEITQAEVDKFIVDNKTQLPAKATKAELEKIAKDQLTTELNNEAINTWLSNLTKNSKVIYRNK